jgi:hypothetical protein
MTGSGGEEASDGEYSGEKTMVSAYFDGYQWAGLKLFSDGSVEKASYYRKGDNGMAIAVWADEFTLELEVPNVCVSELGELEKYIPPGGAAGRGRGRGLHPQRLRFPPATTRPTSPQPRSQE